jgi:hypothetical protein
MEVGNKLYCIKDRVKFVYCGCLYNGMGSIGPGQCGSMESPLTSEEIKKLKPGESYYYCYNKKDNIYEIAYVNMDKNDIRITCDKSQY